MKYLIGLLCLVLFSCTSNKNDEVLIKNLKKAAALQKDRNLRTLQKVKEYCEKNPDEDHLYGILKEMNDNKDKYVVQVLSGTEQDYAKLSSEFVARSLLHLSDKEKPLIKKAMKDSPLYDTELLGEIEDSPILPYQLTLEAEVFIEEMYEVMLKDYAKDHHQLDWGVIYGDNNHHF